MPERARAWAQCALALKAQTRWRGGTHRLGSQAIHTGALVEPSGATQWEAWGRRRKARATIPQNRLKGGRKPSFFLISFFAAAAIDDLLRTGKRRNWPCERTGRLVKREPVFNIPPVILAVLAVLALVHAVRVYLLTPEQSDAVLWLLAFDPIRYGGVLPGEILPGGFGAEIWTFVTYALLHASWIHFGVNAIWFLPFGTAVARRFGPLRFLAFFAVCAAAGAIAHLISYGGQNAPVIGASAAISGTMAGAMRFAFQRGGPLNFWRTGSAEDYRVPAASLWRALREPAVMIFIGAWFGINLLFGMSSIPLSGLAAGEVVAWQAHIGGFIAGLLLFSWFDPIDAAAGGA
jgi:membrane associated rhomboid family serine protease